MPEFNSAPIERYSPQEMQKVKESPDFVPVHRYAYAYEIGHNEVGMLMKPNGDIYKRLFYV